MSVHVLIQNDLCIDDYVVKLKSSYPASSISVTNYLPKLPQQPPVLTDKWLLIVYLSRGYQKQIAASLIYCPIANIVFVTSLRNEEIQAELTARKVTFSVYNNTKIDRKQLEQYVQSELRIGGSLAREVVERSRGYEELVVKNVATLSVLPAKELSMKALKLYLPYKEVVSFRYLYKYILSGQGEYIKIVGLVQQYQYSVDTLIKYLIARLDVAIHVYDFILDGSLTRENVSNMSEVVKCSSYDLIECLQLFNTVTLERLVSLRLFLLSLSKPSPVEFLYKLKGVVL